MGTIKLWKEEYKIGNEKIDAQHRELFRKVEELLKIEMTGNEAENRKECLELLDFLLSYSIFHFEAEEEFQKEVGYVSYLQHVQLHNEFRNTVLNYKKRMEKDFSKETLKKFTGSLMTWLTIHVCNCDRKIVSNQPISPEMSFDGAEDPIRKVIVELLVATYGIAIERTDVSVYKGYIEGKIIIRTIISRGENYVFLFGFSEDMARALYKKISGMEIERIDELNTIERSALMELADIMSSHALAYIDSGKKAGLEWRGDIFMNEYSDSVIDINDSIMLDFDTECGRLEVLYCLAD